MSNRDVSITKNSRKTLLFYNNRPWEKKSGYPDIHVLMCCCDGERFAN